MSRLQRASMYLLYYLCHVCIFRSYKYHSGGIIKSISIGGKKAITVLRNILIMWPPMFLHCATKKC